MQSDGKQGVRPRGCAVKNKLANLRYARGWSQGQLSLYSDVGRATINSIENGSRENPSVKTAMLLAKALKVSVEDIFEL